MSPRERTPEEGAWLEAADGTRHPIRGSCSLGRTAANTIVLESPKVSRRHALIHLQNIGELWLIDFGSSNGTFLNKRRIHHPIRLSDGDQITIGDQVFTLRQPRRHFRGVQNGRDATNVAGDRECSVLASRRGHSRFYAAQPPHAERGPGRSSRSVDFQLQGDHRESARHD